MVRLSWRAFRLIVVLDFESDRKHFGLYDFEVFCCIKRQSDGIILLISALFDDKYGNLICDATLKQRHNFRNRGNGPDYDHPEIRPKGKTHRKITLIDV